MIKKVCLISFILFVLFIQTGSAANKLNYTYSFTEDNSTHNYLFSITIHENFVIYNATLTIKTISYPLILGLSNNTFYTYLGRNILNENALLHLNTSKGALTTTFQIIPTPQPTNSNDQIALLGFIILIALICKYVLLFNQSSNRK